MKIVACVLFFACLVLQGHRDGLAQALAFPTTPEAIARSLAPPSRGLGGVVADKPRVGALIVFDFDSDRIRGESRALLDAFGQALCGPLASGYFLVVGHTDDVGGRAYNQALSLRRAEAVKRYLVKRHGVASDRLACQGRGDEEPLASNDEEAGRARNRRVEFIRER